MIYITIWGILVCLVGILAVLTASDKPVTKEEWKDFYRDIKKDPWDA